MLDYSDKTGLTSDQPKDRYLWTDAFAISNFIQLYKDNNDETYLDLAIDLVCQVHQILGRYHPRDDRTGWIGSENHPTEKGLRIGKPLPERKKNEAFDRIREWKRDGQYFHYLTKWIQALLKIGKQTGKQEYYTWAVDLARASINFVHGARMFWKMSTDLTYPLVTSMGQNDPIDGYVTYSVIEYMTEEDFSEEINRMEHFMSQVSLFTTDPLGLGGLLVNTYQLNQIEQNTKLQHKIIEATEKGLEHVEINHELAFRELGLAIGLKACKHMEVLDKYWNMDDKIVNYWEDVIPSHDSRMIDMVMLATALSPDAFLNI